MISTAPNFILAGLPDLVTNANAMITSASDETPRMFSGMMLETPEDWIDELGAVMLNCPWNGISGGS